MNLRSYQVEVHTEETTYQRHRLTIQAETADQAAQHAILLVDAGATDAPAVWIHSEHGRSEAFEVLEVQP